MDNVLSILKERGLIEDITSPDIQRILDEPTTVYAGFDPTSDSLQVGNLATIMVLARFQRCGHRVIAVVGGATGMIGDPSGKASERALLKADDVRANTEGIRENLSRFLDVGEEGAAARILNNYDWLKDFSFIDFLRDVGKHFRMGAMLGRESVQARLQSESGMSFTEFSYSLLQAADFLRLFDSHGCVLQIGGSDQWGNITAGIDLIHKARGADVYGVTIPLVCDSSGQKLGKSEGNAVYLDQRKTSCYDFYQFFVRTEDADVARLLKIFTFLSMEEIRELEKQVREAPEQRAAQKRLAEEVTRLAHGEHGLEIAVRASSILFGASMEGLHADDLLEIFSNVASTEMTSQDVEQKGVIDVTVAAGLCSSKGEARRLVQNGGLYLNNARVEKIDACVRRSDVIDGRILVLRSGKKNFHLVKVQT